MINQQFSNGFEIDGLQETQQQYSEEYQGYGSYTCPNCTEPITNPICHDCLGKDVLKWLSFYPDIKKSMSGKIKKYVREVNNSALHSLNCVACNKKKAALCPYCFTEGVFNIFRKDRINIHVIGDFLSVFNFDLEKTGYMSEGDIN